MRKETQRYLNNKDREGHWMTNQARSASMRDLKGISGKVDMVLTRLREESDKPEPNYARIKALREMAENMIQTLQRKQR